jgi:hypothetical protein
VNYGQQQHDAVFLLVFPTSRHLGTLANPIDSDRVAVSLSPIPAPHRAFFSRLAETPKRGVFSSVLPIIVFTLHPHDES